MTLVRNVVHQRIFLGNFEISVPIRFYVYVIFYVIVALRIPNGTALGIV